jgi:hypothetical protein
MQIVWVFLRNNEVEHNAMQMKMMNNFSSPFRKCMLLQYNVEELGSLISSIREGCIINHTWVQNGERSNKCEVTCDLVL